MDEQETLSQLEALAERLGIKVRREPFKSEGSTHSGALCRIHGQDVLIVHKKATKAETRHLLVDTLKRYDLSGLYILPSLRALLDLPNDDPPNSL